MRVLAKTISESRELLVATAVYLVICLSGLAVLTRRLDAQIDAQDMDPSIRKAVPDTRMMGYTHSELYEWYGAIGAQGRAAHQELALWDVFPFLPSYIVCIMTMTLYGAERQRTGSRAARRGCAADDAVPETVYWLPPATFVCDLVETATVWYGSRVYPQALAPRIVTLASACTQMKNMLLVVWALTLAAVLFGPLPRRDYSR